MNQTIKDNLLVKVATQDKTVKFLGSLSSLCKEAAAKDIISSVGDYAKGVAGNVADASKEWLSKPENQLSLASGVGAGGLLYALTGALPGSKKYRGARLLLSLLSGAGAGFGAHQYATNNWPAPQAASTSEDDSWITAVPRFVQSAADKIMGVPEAERRAAEAAADTQHFRDTRYMPFQENKQKADKKLREANAEALARSGELAARDTAEMVPAMLDYFTGLKAKKQNEARLAALAKLKRDMTSNQMANQMQAYFNNYKGK